MTPHELGHESAVAMFFKEQRGCFDVEWQSSRRCMFLHQRQSCMYLVSLLAGSNPLFIVEQTSGTWQEATKNSANIYKVTRWRTSVKLGEVFYTRHSRRTYNSWSIVNADVLLFGNKMQRLISSIHTKCLHRYMLI